MPRGRSAAKPSSVAKKAVVKAGSPTPTKRKVSAKKKMEDEEDRISISSDSGDEKMEVKTPTRKSGRSAKKAKLSEEETPTKKTPKGKKSIKVESDDDVTIVASSVKRKASRNRPPSPGTLEYEKLEPITFAKNLKVPSGTKRQAVQDEEKPSKRIRVDGIPKSDKSSKEIIFGMADWKASGLKRKRVESSEDEESSELEDEVSDNSRIRRTKSKAKSVFIDDEAGEADEESEGEEEEEEEETSVVEESIEEILAESVESATESVSESVEVVQVVKVEKKGKGKEKAKEVKVRQAEEEKTVEKIDKKGKGKEKVKEVEDVNKGQAKESSKDSGQAKEEGEPDNSDLEDEEDIIVEGQIDEGDVKEKKPEVDSKTPKAKEKRFKPDPSKNVMDKDFMDPKLMDTYKDLPWINKASLTAYAGSPNSPGLVDFRDWDGTIDPYQEEKIKSWITFQRSGRYVNLSRADPEDLDESKNPTKVTDQSKGFNKREDSFLCLYDVHHSTCIAISVIKVMNCYLVTPKQTDKSRIRRIDGIMHNIEMDRFMGCAGMIWKFNSLSSSMYQWTMSFETKRHALSTVASSAPSSPEKASASASPSKPSRNPVIDVRREKPDSEDDMLAKGKAKARKEAKVDAKEEGKAESSKQGSKHDPMMAPFKKRVLDFEDDVPIYDGRYKKLDPKRQVHKVSHLPLYKDGGEDLPKGSLAVVGYTMCTTYPFGGQNKKMTYNVQWVVLLGLPLNEIL